jgi:ABC-type sugar transport system ATPase subunit
MNAIEGTVNAGTFQGDLSWPVKAPDGKAVLGVRPEDLQLGDGPWKGVIDLVENLGADRLVHVKIGDRTLVARTGADGTYERGAEIALKPLNVHVFSR